MSEEADFVTILSSDMIAQIVEEYFNKKVYKQQVEVVDTKQSEAGYMFSLAFVNRVAQVTVQSKERQPTALEVLTAMKRNNKGQFVKEST